jgi:subtilase family serine protease
VPRAVLAGFLALTLFVSSSWPLQPFSDAATVEASSSVVAAATDVPEADVRSCAAARPGQARCHARVRTDAKVRGKRPLAPGERPAQTDVNGQPAATSIGNGGAYDPPYLQSAYNLASIAATSGTGATVAIVDAMDDPTAEADLAAYRSHFGLSACTSMSGCFRKLNQTGAASPLPATDGGWAQEVSVDLDIVSAICPNCNILLIEADSGSFSDLGAAVNTAASLGATVINNSYGAGEWSGEVGYWDAFYNHPGIPVVASTGDVGYGVEFPASTPYTIAVGGTTLNQLTNTGTRNATETVWSGSGAGCSAYEPKPTWQHDNGCALRTVADVAAVADPNTGVWVYDSTSFNGQVGWLVFGGTSVAAPIVASIYALSANHAMTDASGLYTAPSGSLFDIVAGTDGACALPYLCTGMLGFDGPSGNGTPNGAAAFGGPAGNGTGGNPTSTPTPTSVPTSTATATATATRTPTVTATATRTASPTATATATSGTGGTTTLGLKTIGSIQDTGCLNAMNGSKVTVGASALSVTSVSAYVGSVDSAPRNQYSLAIFTDVGGAPGSLVAQSAAGTLKANAWNTLPVTATLQANASYWLMYNTNAGNSVLNNLTYSNDAGAVGAYGPQAFGGWPASFGKSTTGAWRYAMYATGTVAGAATNTPTATSTPTSTVTSTATVTPTATSTPLPTATSTPTAASTPTPVATETPTATATATSSPTATTLPTATATSSPTATITPTATSTPLPTATRTPTATPTPTSVSGPSQTLGLTTVGSILDSGSANYMNGSRVVVGPQAMTATSLSAYVGTIDASPRNQFSMAIYADNNGKPGALLAQTAAGTLKANTWNTLPVSASLSANTAYWIFYNTNGSNTLMNNLFYNSDPSQVGAYRAATFGTWPSSFGAATLGGWRYSIYVSGTL